MSIWSSSCTVLIALLFGVIGFYLCLIAKFYRVKFGRGPHAGWMQSSLSMIVTGIFLRVMVFSGLPVWIPAILVTSGSLAFSIMAYNLYRTMLSL